MARELRRRVECETREDTGNSRAEIPRAPARSIACFTATVGPAITVCRGPFQFATRTSGTSRMSRLDDVRASQQGCHRTRRTMSRLMHESAAGQGELGERRCAQDAGGMDGNELSIAMTGQDVRLAAEVTEQPKHADTRRADRWLGHICLHKRSAVLLTRVLIEGRRRENDRTPAAGFVSQ